jgi:hypothetical protein
VEDGGALVLAEAALLRGGRPVKIGGSARPR